MKVLTVENELKELQKKYHALKWKERYLEIINSFTLHLMQLNSIDEVVWGIAKQVIAKMELEDCVIYLLDENILIQKAAHGPKNPEQFDIMNPITIPVGKGIVGTVAKTGKPEIISDTREDARYILDDNYRLSEIAIPIIYENKVIGVIDSEHSQVDFFTNEHLIILETIASISANKIMHAKANETLKLYQQDLENQVTLKTQDLNQVVDKLTRSNQDLESFAYAASHDLQEPLRSIISYLQLIERRETNLSEESKEYFNYVVNGAKRMKSLMQGLLEYSRVSSFQEDQLEDIDMNNLMELIKANLYSAIEEKAAKVDFKNLHQIKGNRTQLIQLFQNIISNALKFGKKEVNVIVEISSKETAQFIEYTISDNGIGIDPKFYNKIFGLFNRLNPIGTFQGSGIGLALCKRIVENHKGEISIQSELGTGSEFYLKFPKA